MTEVLRAVPGPRTSLPSSVDNWRVAEQGLVCLTLFAIGLRQSLHAGLTSGYVLALLLLPLWIRTLVRYRGTSLFVVGGLVAAVSGYALSEYSGPTNVVSGSFRDSSLALLIGVIVSVGVVVWARELVSVTTIGVCYGFGMFACTVINHLPAQGNAWKFLYAMPTAIVLLAAARAALRPRKFEIVLVPVLALMSVLFDSRSYFGTFVLAALLVLWQMRPKVAGHRSSPLMTVGLMACVGGALYYVGSTLLVNGYLGAAAQARSVAQIQASGSLIIGGRPELQATLALFRDHPAGFGFGVIANPNQILVAKTGLNSINYAPNNGYVDRFMFGNQIELHSVIGDLWAQCGILGIAFTAIVAFIVIRGSAHRIASSTASALLLYLSFWTLWNVFFSPLFSAAPTMALAVGLAFVRRSDATPHVDAAAADA